LNLERTEQNCANENKYGAHSQYIQSSQSKVHGSASLVELAFSYHERPSRLSLRRAVSNEMYVNVHALPAWLAPQTASV
jgi:hypothetical protein